MTIMSIPRSAIIRLMLMLVLALPAMSATLTAAPIACWTASRPEYTACRSVAVVSLLQDEDSGSPGAIPSLVEQDFRNAGFKVKPEPEDAELVVVATSGRIGTIRSASSDESTASVSGLHSSNSGLMAEQMGQSESSVGGGEARAGLLLTAYRSADWDSLSETGKIPAPVWRVFVSGYYTQSALATGVRELASCAVSKVAQSVGQAAPKKSNH